MSSSDLSSTRHICGADMHAGKAYTFKSETVFYHSMNGTCPHGFTSIASTALWDVP